MDGRGDSASQPVGRASGSWVLEYALVVIRNAPRPWVQIKPVSEIAVLGGTAEFCITIAAPDSPGAATRAVVVLEHLHVVARVPQLKGGDETSDALTAFDRFYGLELIEVGDELVQVLQIHRSATI